MIIKEDLLKRLLVAFPDNAQKIKKYAEEEEDDKLLKLLLETTSHFDEDIKALKEGRLKDVPSREERKKRDALILEVIGVCRSARCLANCRSFLFFQNLFYFL